MAAKKNKTNQWQQESENNFERKRRLEVANMQKVHYKMNGNVFQVWPHYEAEQVQYLWQQIRECNTEWGLQKSTVSS